MNREELYDIVVDRSPSRNLVSHMLAVEAIMRGLAIHFHEDADKWGLAGLVHDIDYAERGQTKYCTALSVLNSCT